MFKDYIENANFEDTGFSYTLSLISGKYKMVILYCLMEFKVVRYNELKRYIKTISHKTLSSSLKELDNSQRVPADPAQGGVQPVGKRELAHGNT